MFLVVWHHSRMTGSTEIDTGRLRLRPPMADDIEDLSRIQQDPEMMRYMSDGHLPTVEETQSWLTWHADLWRQRGFSVWSVELKPERNFIGWLGITEPTWFPELMPTPEIGWFIDRDYWGQGLATEGAIAAIRFAFDELDIERLIGIYNAQNLASGRVMEKIGMTFWKETPHPRFGFPLRVYEINR